MANGRKTGGRVAGTPNKNTATIRQFIINQWQQYQDSGQFREDLDALDPQTRATLMERYAQYITPKMKSVDLDVEQQVNITIEDRLAQLCEEN